MANVKTEDTMNVFQWMWSVITTSLNSVTQTWPEDKETRRRMQACMRGGGMVGHCATKIETEDAEEIKPDE